MPEAHTGAFTCYKRQMLRETLPPFMNASPKDTSMSPLAHFRTPPLLTLTIFCGDNSLPKMGNFMPVMPQPFP